MDEEHTAHLQRILANRKKRGASVQRAPTPSRSVSVSVADSQVRYADSSVGPTSPMAVPPPQQATHSTQANVYKSPPHPASPPPAARPLRSPPLEVSRQRTTPVYEEELPPPSAPPPPQAVTANLQPVTIRQPPLHRSASASNIMPPPTSTSQAAAALFTKGLFSNFRHAPILVSPNVRPYRSASTGAAHPRPRSPTSTTSPSRQNTIPNRQTSPRGGGGNNSSPNRGGSPHGNKGKLMATYAEPVTSRNPFRQQPFEEFSANPRYGPPADFVPVGSLGEQLSSKRLPNAPVRQSTVAVEHIKPKALPSASTKPLFNLADCVQVLSRGDWFLKWTRKGQVHKRYFWLDVQRGCLVWGKHPDSSILLTSSLRLADVISIQAQCVVEDETNRTYYKMHVVTQERFLHIATEKRDKFDVWYDSIQRLSDNLRRSMHFPHHGERMTEAPFKADRHPDTGLVQFGTSDD